MNKFGLRAFGLAMMAAVSLMAFSAVAAQAEDLTDGGKAALFEILKSSALVAGATYTANLEKWTDGLLHGFLLVEKSNLSILCTGLTVTGGTFNSDVEAVGSVTFKGCVAFNFAGTEKLAGCTILSKAEGGEKEVIVATGKVLPRKHEGESYLLAEPTVAGSTFTNIFFEKEKGCVLPFKNEIKGTLGALVKEKEAVIGLITANAAIQKLMGDALTFGVNPAVVDGNATTELTGKHLGCSFGVV
jgi:hypothetical protein